MELAVRPVHPLPEGTEPASHLVFGRFELQPLERRLLVGGVPAPLGSRALDVLEALVERAGRLITKSELMDLVWPNTVVEENNLQSQVSALRKVLGSDIIATIPGRGYRFTASVTRRRPQDAAALPVGPAAPEEAAASVPTAAPAACTTTNLPAELTPLLGRDHDLASLGELMSVHRLVSIVGAGGMGKTLIAQHLLRMREARHRHGVCFIELAQVADGTQLPAAIATGLGLSLADGQPLEALAKAVKGLEVLIALDNAEHLVDEVARVVDTLMQRSPAVHLLVTSQAALKLAHERVYRIGALSVPQGPLAAADARVFGSVALFVERARALDSRFALTDFNAPQVIEVCRALDGLALAIELAAARAPAMGVAGLVASMGERLKVLTRAANRMAPERQRTLRSALEWSHGLLSADQQTVFRRLSAIPTSADLALVQAVCSDSEEGGHLDAWTVLDVLDELVDRSLVALVTAPEAAADARYKLLDSPRALAMEKLEASQEAHAVTQRLCREMLRRADDFEASLRGNGAKYVHDLETVRSAYRALKSEGRLDDALTCAEFLHWLTEGTASFAERAARAADARQMLSSDLTPRAVARAWTLISMHLTQRRTPDAAEAALRLWEAAQPFKSQTWCWFGASALRRMAWQDYARAEEYLAQAIALENPDWPAPWRRATRRQAYIIARMRGDEEAVRRWKLLFDATVVDVTNWEDGLTTLDWLIEDGKLDAAVELGETLCRRGVETRREDMRAYALLNLCAARIARNELHEARRLAREGWAGAIAFDFQAYWADYLSLLNALDGRFDVAARLIGYADAVYERHHDMRQFNESSASQRARALVLEGLGEARVAALRGDGKALTDEQAHPLGLLARES